MSYTISDSCSICESCQIKCPTGAIKIDDGEYWIDQKLCNNCEGYYEEPQCIVQCPISSPSPTQAKKGRYKTVARVSTSPELFINGKNTPFASSMVIWEGCSVLTRATALPWEKDPEGYLYYERSVKQGRGKIIFRLNDTLDFSCESIEYLSDPSKLELIDIRAACLHLLFAAYTTTLEKPWEEEFIISDQQIEQYLGLDKRKDLSKATKLTLIKTLVQQPCQLLASIDWPQQGKVKGFTVPENPLWHLLKIQHHFQIDDSGCQHLTGLTFTLKAGIWAKYFLNKQAYSQRIAFYQYGSLPHFLLNTVMSIWQQHQGAVRIMLWLLFKSKMGRKQCITVPTLMRVAYGQEKMAQADIQREQRKRLLRTFESDLEVLNHYGIKAVFDPVSYPSTIQPLWVKLAELPDDAEEALDFWINDGSQEHRLTDAGPRGKWNWLMKARILNFELPAEWEEQLAKFEQKKQRKSNRKTRVKKSPEFSAEQILAARQSKGLSQRALAEKIGKSQSWIRDLENGRFSAKPEDRAILQSVLEIS
ncbi:helix-turn-helix domain-containing protein [Crocosphaera sp. XPORK-15E]|uniref:helix-turn-helix domain-containing protein n=1 Tax=Crocosphaera sp. XPORK-15E TaxID=3110247 RepID=UPI002B1F8D30|nr:helix-turn-helix domain-containing protein [Crocosphaera sp. XPORK-15E]MEA5536080.1 helix-turn-helix domain-containing protein [Crocosphaera sp. XPORK-15E]